MRSRSGSAPALTLEHDQAERRPVSDVYVTNVLARQRKGFGELAADGRGGVAAVVGLGHVGLATALSLLDADTAVIGIDVSRDRLAAIAAAEVELRPADGARLAEHVGREELVLTADPERLTETGTVLVCVPAPVTDHLAPDLVALRAACATVVAHAVPGQSIVLTSTTYVGSTRDLLVEPLAARGLVAGRDVSVAFSPERTDPGVPAHAPESTPRVVGGVTPRCAQRAAEVLGRTAPLVHVVSSPEAAELTKLVESTFRAVNAALANELADVANELDLEILEVVAAAATQPHGLTPFYPGIGALGVSRDPYHLLWQLAPRRVPIPVVSGAMTALAVRPRKVVARIRELLADAGEALAGARVCVVGVTEEPDVAEVGASSALEIIRELADANASVSYVDPMAPAIRAGRHVLEAIDDAPQREWDLVLVHTRHTDVDHGWLAERALVLDTTYPVVEAPQRAVL